VTEPESLDFSNSAKTTNCINGFSILSLKQREETKFSDFSDMPIYSYRLLQIPHPSHVVMRTRGGEASTKESGDDDSESDQSRSWIKSLGQFEFPPRPRVVQSDARVSSSLRDIFYVPEWVSASEEAEIIRRADSAPDSAWIAEAGRRFQV
jgi:hypothetical protein